MLDRGAEFKSTTWQKAGEPSWGKGETAEETVIPKISFWDCTEDVQDCHIRGALSVVEEVFVKRKSYAMNARICGA